MSVPLDLTGRHALVCGASRGIGHAAALAIGSLGARVTLLARSPDLLEETADRLSSDGVDADFVVADLDDRDHLVGRIDAVLEDRGPVHVLVNNTGGPPSGRLLDAGTEDLQIAFGRHVLAAHLLVQRTLPGMAEAGYGRIVNIVSISVREPIPNLGVSNTIRAAMAGWAKTLSRELPPGVTINNVLPGYTATSRLDELKHAISARTGQTIAEVEAGWTTHVPEGRIADPAELGAVIAFLVSPAASFVRGVSLPVDGGRLFSI
jgi:3-oxoacyl-[acyl-carrier protein] reductase